MKNDTLNAMARRVRACMCVCVLFSLLFDQHTINITFYMCIQMFDAERVLFVCRRQCAYMPSNMRREMSITMLTTVLYA